MTTRIARIFLWVYAVSAGLFLAGVLVQVFLAGLAVVSRRTGWENHAGLGHGLGIPLLVMLAVMFPAKLPAGGRWLTGLLFALYFLQADIVIFMRDTAPYAAALHPVLALFDFLLIQYLLGRSIRLLRGARAPDAAGSQPAGEHEPGGLRPGRT